MNLKNQYWLNFFCLNKKQEISYKLFAQVTAFVYEKTSGNIFLALKTAR